MNTEKKTFSPRIILVDTNEELVKEWTFYFAEFENIEIHCGDIIPVIEKHKSAHIVSPANSFGDMQGGIDLVYYNYFGHKLEEKIQTLIQETKHSELVVGDALILEEYKLPRMIFAPTMRVPMNISNTINVYLAFRAVLIAIYDYNYSCQFDQIEMVICPGMGTGIGKVSPAMCAKQMYKAYIDFLNPPRHLDLLNLTKYHCDMLQVTENI